MVMTVNNSYKVISEVVNQDNHGAREARLHMLGLVH